MKKEILYRIPLTPEEHAELGRSPCHKSLFDALSPSTIQELTSHLAAGRTCALEIASAPFPEEPKAFLLIHEAGVTETVFFNLTERHLIEVAAHGRGISVEELVRRASLYYADGVVTYQVPRRKAQMQLAAQEALEFKKSVVVGAQK